MDSNQCFRWNKQWLTLSSCFVSLCLLPTAVEGGMLGDLRMAAYDSNSNYSQINDSQEDNSFSQEINPYIAATEESEWGNYAAEGNTNNAMDESPVAYGRESRDNRSNTFSDDTDGTQTANWQVNTFGQTEQPAEEQAYWSAHEHMTTNDFESHLHSFTMRANTEDASESMQADASMSTASEWNDENATTVATDSTWDASVEGKWPADAPWSCVDSCEPCMPSCCWGNFRIFGDFLYWNLCQNNLDFAICARDVSGINLGSTTSASSVFVDPTPPIWFQGRFKVKSVSTKYKPGFRVGGFYSSLCSNWEFGLVYTQLHSQYCNRSRVANDSATVLPTQIPSLVDVATLLFRDRLNEHVHSKLHFQYNMLDVIATTSYCNDGCLTWQPYVGARFLEIKERWNVRYAFNVLSAPVENVSASSKWHSKLPTGGVTFGVGGAYNFCGCWNVIGRVGASCVGGTAKQRTSLNASFVTSSSSSALNPTRVTKRKCAILTGFEGALGLAYTLNCCKLGMQLGVGYEFQTWLNVPTPIEHGVIIPGLRHNASTNLTVHGLFVRAGISF